jgi:nucleotide-binding universal stress UspA family protein
LTRVKLLSRCNSYRDRHHANAPESAMSLRRLLVLLDGTPSSHGAAKVARQLALDLGATLHGIAPTGRVELPLGTRDAGVLLDAEISLVQLLRDRAEQAASQFTQACERAGVTGPARVENDLATAAILKHVAACDLVVIGQPDPSNPGHADARQALEEVILQGARPVLVVPYANAVSTVGTHVLAAWDGGRESSRALAEALPLMARAARVGVTRWHGNDLRAADERTADREALDELGGWLHAHGIDATVEETVAVTPVGEALLSRAADVGADLIVAGAYGHARWSQRILGGVTRTLLDAATVPLLMAR